MILLVLGLSLAFAATNVDNLAFLVAVVPRAGRLRATAAFVLVQGAAVLAAAGAGAAAGELPAELLGWLGLVPLALGVRALLKASPDEPAGGAGRTSFGALVLAFAGMTADTFVLTATFLADSATRFDPAVLAAAALAIAAMVVLSTLALGLMARSKTLLARLERATPFVMIASGLYILADTLTDVA